MNEIELLSQLKGSRHRNLGRVQASKEKLQRSASMKGKNQGEHNGMHGKHLERITTSKGGTFTIHSIEERAFAEMLDADPTVLEFHYEAIKVRYFWRGTQQGFTIDFLVRTCNGWELVEIKTPRELNRQTCAKLLGASLFASKLNWPFYLWNGSSYFNITECAFKEQFLSNNEANSGKAKEKSMLIPSQAEKETSRACVETMSFASFGMMR